MKYQQLCLLCIILLSSLSVCNMMMTIVIVVVVFIMNNNNHNDNFLQLLLLIFSLLLPFLIHLEAIHIHFFRRFVLRLPSGAGCLAAGTRVSLTGGCSEPPWRRVNDPQRAAPLCMHSPSAYNHIVEVWIISGNCIERANGFSASHKEFEQRFSEGGGEGKVGSIRRIAISFSSYKNAKMCKQTLLFVTFTDYITTLQKRYERA